MRKKLIIHLWLLRFAKYLLIPTALCAILLPLYGIFRQQVYKAQLTDAAKQLSASVSQFENYLYDIRYVTNKLFHDQSFSLLAATTDETILYDDTIAQHASQLLDDLTYSLSPVSYSYVTFPRSKIIVDDHRVFPSYTHFYPSVLEYTGLDCQQWFQLVRSDKMSLLPVQKILLYQTAYPDSYLTVSQPFFDTNGRYMGTCSMLLREKQLLKLFLPHEQWQKDCLFYIAAEDGTVLIQHNYDADRPLENIHEDGAQTYDGEKFLLVRREISSIDATAVIGVPYSVYSDNLETINYVIVTYILLGLLGCLILSAAMTLLDLRHITPMLDTLGNGEATGGRLVEEMILQKLRHHDLLSLELERTRNQLDHGRMETLLRLGSMDSVSDQAQFREKLGLTEHNYLLLIPMPTEPAGEMSDGFRQMLIAEQIYQCFSSSPYIHNAADGSVLAILTAQSGDRETLAQMQHQAAQLYKRLDMHQTLIISTKFTQLEQLSSVYWQVRNAVAYCEPNQPVYCVSEQTDARAAVPEVTVLELLNEYLMAGYTEKAQALIRQSFGSGSLSLSTFRQTFYSLRGVLLAAAEKTGCEDITYLCTYDSRQPIQKQIQNLCECCLSICAHVDLLKQSHNEQLRQRVMQWLEDNYGRPDLNAAMVADQFHISKKYVSQFLKDQTGKSYNEYVEDLRLSHAMDLLRSSQLGITEIANLCGFSSQNTFYKAFRRRYDISPSSVRRDSTQT